MRTIIIREQPLLYQADGGVEQQAEAIIAKPEKPMAILLASALTPPYASPAF